MSPPHKTGHTVHAKSPALKNLVARKDSDRPHKHALAMNKWPPVYLDPASTKPFADVAKASVWFFGMAVAFDFLYCRKNSYPSRPYSGTFLLFYMALTMYYRIKDAKHSARFYEMLWGCNMAIALSGLGCILGRPLLVSTGVMIVGLDQLLWYVECLVYLLLGKFPFGVASYMVWPQTSLVRKITTLHHLWFLPFGLYCLSPASFNPVSFLSAMCLNIYLVIAARLFTPCNLWFPITDAKVALKSEGKEKHSILDESGKYYMDYLNINCGFEFWSDVPIKILHLCNGKSPWLYVPYMSCCMNALQLLPFGILCFLSKKFLEESHVGK